MTGAADMEDLRAKLDRAERDLLCADMIDNFDRWQRETARCRARVAELRAQIARIEEAA